MSETNNALLVAAAELRNLSRFEFLFDADSTDGLFLPQLALDLRRLADGCSLRSTAVWRAFTAYRKEYQKSQFTCGRPGR